jgi:hypothetical protein
MSNPVCKFDRYGRQIIDVSTEEGRIRAENVKSIDDGTQERIFREERRAAERRMMALNQQNITIAPKIVNVNLNVNVLVVVNQEPPKKKSWRDRDDF